MNARFAVALSIAACILAAGALTLGVYEVKHPVQQVATAQPAYMLIVTGNHYTKTEDFGSMEKCSEAATYFSAGSAGQLMANCVSKR